MVSICVVTYNGEKYIREQITSILVQLGESDEIIISDDGSTDHTLDILYSFSDKRMVIYSHEKTNQRYGIDYVTHNVEFALSKCSGDYIFLSDQDDIWLPSKLELMMTELKKTDIVLSNCKVVDSALNTLYASYFEVVNTRIGLYNIIKNSYLGCCMAFRREILKKVLPFPKTGVGHDLWIGLIGSVYYKVALIEEPLLLYRKHGNNVTPSAMKSTYPLSFKIYYRILIIKALLKRIFFGI